MRPLAHPLLSERAADALAGRPFILSDRFSQSEWDVALWYANEGEPDDLEHMLDLDAAAERADSIARHDPAYRDGHIGLDDWLGGRDLLAFTPVRTAP